MLMDESSGKSHSGYDNDEVDSTPPLTLTRL
jgi:hypothetical protein